jgi:hypothetical protein
MNSVMCFRNRDRQQRLCPTQKKPFDSFCDDFSIISSSNVVAKAKLNNFFRRKFRVGKGKLEEGAKNYTFYNKSEKIAFLINLK